MLEIQKRFDIISTKTFINYRLSIDSRNNQLPRIC